MATKPIKKSVSRNARTKADLARESKRAARLLRGKTILRIWRHRKNEVGIEFEDGTRLFVNGNELGLELSVT